VNNDLPEDFEIVDDETIAMIEKTISHPCEDVFDIEPGTTTTMIPAPRHTQLVRSDMYDDKDAEIEEQYQEIYDKAMDFFDDIQNEMEGIEGKYKARNGEVGVQFLNAALSAAKEKSRLKEHKDKTLGVGSAGEASITNNTQINISTSDLIKQFAMEQNPTHNHTPDEVVEPIEDKPSNSRTTIKRKKKLD
jgi:hypothetical protein